MTHRYRPRWRRCAPLYTLIHPASLYGPYRSSPSCTGRDQIIR